MKQKSKKLIFFDEIQVCPNARTALKAFTIDKRYDVIASGSLLGLSFGQDPTIEEIKSVPVGYENEPILAYKLIDGNVGVDGKKIILPHYMALFI